MSKAQWFIINMMQKNPDGVNDDMTLMGANGLTPAYFIASEGTIASLNLAYTLPVQDMGKLKAIRFYNDYSYLDKNVRIGLTRR